MQIKTCIILCFIYFLLGSGITCGVGFFIFNQRDREHDSELAKRDAIITAIEDDLLSANNTIEELADIRKQIETGTINGLDIIRELEDSQRSFRERLSGRKDETSSGGVEK